MAPPKEELSPKATEVGMIGRCPPPYPPPREGVKNGTPRRGDNPLILNAVKNPPKRSPWVYEMFRYAQHERGGQDDAERGSAKKPKNILKNH